MKLASLQARKATAAATSSALPILHILPELWVNNCTGFSVISTDIDMKTDKS